MLAYIPFIYFTLWLILHLANPKMRFGAGAMSLLWIDISAFFSIILDIRNLYGQYGCNEYAVSIVGIISYCCLWTIIIKPLLSLDDKTINIIPDITKPKLFKFLCVFLILCIVLHIFSRNLILEIVEAMQKDGVERYSEQLGNETYTGGAMHYWLWIPNIVSTFTPLYILCWFISITICKQPYWIRMSLLLASTLAMLLGFINGGRAQLIWWIITFLVYFFLLKPKLSAKQVKRIITIMGSFAGILFLGIIAITISRFDEGQTDAFNSFVGYAGQQINNYCSLLPYVDLAHLYPDRIFPLYQYVIKNHPYDMLQFYSQLENTYPILVNVFFTIFGGILIDTGLLGLIIFLVIYRVIMRILNRQLNIQLPLLYLFGVIFCIPIRGLFGWPYTNYNNSIYILFSIFLFIIFKYHFVGTNKHR